MPSAAPILKLPTVDIHDDSSQAIRCRGADWWTGLVIGVGADWGNCSGVGWNHDGSRAAGFGDAGIVRWKYLDIRNCISAHIAEHYDDAAGLASGFWGVWATDTFLPSPVTLI